jgi:prepilin-type N-terminal cleavage/methylation domain-containing protein
MTPHRSHRRNTGFTLVELLVAIAIFGVILAGLLALVRGTARFTSLNVAVSTSVEDLSDAEGYVIDSLREAKSVISGEVHVVDSATSTTVFICDNDPASPTNPSFGRCISVYDPVVDGTNPAAPIINYDLSVFVVQPIEDLYSATGLEPGWQGEDTLALIEYKRPSVCSSGCSNVADAIGATPRTLGGALEVPAANPGLLLRNLAAEDGAGNDVLFFDVGDARTSLLLNLVVRADSESAPFVVSQVPVALQVGVRGNQVD